MHTLFGTAPVSLQDGLVIIGAGAVMMVVLELEKLVMRRSGALRRLGV